MIESIKDSPLWIVTMSTILALLPLIKFLHHILHSNRSYKVQNLEALSKALEGRDNIANKLIVEQFFINQFKVRVDYETIVILLGYSSPTRAIDLYRSSKKYLKKNRSTLVYIDEFQNPKKRHLEKYKRPIINLSLYWLWAMIAGFSGLYTYRSFDINIVFQKSYFLYNGAIWTLCSMLSFVSITVAIRYLTDKENIKNAEALINLDSHSIVTTKWHY
jgi:hypothetical protein